MKLTLHLTGNRPMLMHNGRLANPLDPWTQQLKALNAKRKKTDEDLMAILQAEARGAIYETPDGVLGFPTQNVWRCVYDSAKAFKLGEDIKRSLSFEDVIEPLGVHGVGVVNVESFLADTANIDYRPVKIQRAKVMRARPVARNWTTSHKFELLDDVLNPRDLVPVLQRAGRLVGLGDWRPTYGTFDVEVET